MIKACKKEKFSIGYDLLDSHRFKKFENHFRHRTVG